MGHVRPHLWADAAAGRLGDGKRRAMDAHADACPRCAAERDRVRAACDTLGDLREQAAREQTQADDETRGLPPLGWDHIGAQIYWSTSSERRARASRPERWPRWRVAIPVGIGVAAVAVVAVLALGDSDRRDDAAGRADSIADTAASPTPDLTSDPTPDLPPSPAAGTSAAGDPGRVHERAAPLVGVMILLQGRVTVDGQPVSDLTHAVAAGQRIETQDGRLAVQFGAGSGFALGPNTAVTLAAFDARRVELAVDGELAVAVSHRAPEQQFLVTAGAHRVEVRGTRFRVAHRSGGVEVACSEGRVVVSAAVSEAAVDAGEQLRIDPHDPSASLGDILPRPMTPDEIADLDAMVPMLPAWTDAPSLRSASAVLRVDAAPGRSVKVDGIPIVAGAFQLRVPPGRHMVQSADADDVWSEGAWIPLDAGAVVATEVRATRPASTPRPSRITARDNEARRAELRRTVHNSARISGCLAPLRKAGLADNAFAVLDVGIDARGNIGHLNIVEHNLNGAIARCVRDEVDRIRFRRGANAQFRIRLSLSAASDAASEQ